MILIFILYIACVVLPPLFWFFVVRKIDEDKSESIKILLLVFAMGIGAGFLALWANGIVDYFLGLHGPTPLEKFFEVSRVSPLSAFLAGPIEESLKLFLLFEIFYHRKEFHRIREGVIFAIICALGFSFLENTLYFFGAVVNGPEYQYLGIGVVRAIASTFIHVSAATVSGWYLGKARFSLGNKTRCIITGLVLAALLHGFSNLLLVYLNIYGLLIEFVLCLIVFIVIFKKMKRAEEKLALSVQG